MKIKTKELQQALSIVRPGLSNKEILDQTTSFAFLKGRIVTYNDEISISHPFEGDFEGAIKAEELYGLLTRIDKEEINLEIKETEILLTAGRVKAGLRLETVLLLPLKEIPKKMYDLPNPEQFREFVGMAMQNCSNDASQPRLTCVHVRQDGGIVGSDSFRLMSCKGEELPVESFLLPARNAAEAIKIKPTKIALDKGWAHFKNEEGTTLSCRKLNDDYVPQEAIDNVLKFSVSGKVDFPAKISEMIDRVSPFAKRDSFMDEVVEVVISGEKITLKAKSENTNSWIEERSSIKCNKDVSFNITPTLFREIVKDTRLAVFDKSMTKMKIEGKGWLCVLMLRGKG